MLSLSPIERVKQALRDHGARPDASGKHWTCPAHEDRTPSLGLDEKENGDALLYCRAGCSFDAIVEKLGLAKADLFANPRVERAARPRRPGSQPGDVQVLGPATAEQIKALIDSRRITPGETLEWIGARRVHAYGLEWLGLPNLGGGWKLWGFNFAGQPRFEEGKLSRRNVGPVSLIVSLDLRGTGATSIQRLWDLEGESDALAAIDLGMRAVVAGTGGAASLAGHNRHRDVLLALEPSEVVVVRDLDEPGRAGAQKAADWWLAQGVPVRVLELPAELGDGGDVRDFLLGRIARDGTPARAPLGCPTDLDALADTASLRQPVRCDTQAQEQTASAAGSAAASDLRTLLAELPELEYQQRRSELAKSAGIGVGALDRVRCEARRASPRSKASRGSGEPWPDPVDGAQLAAGIEAALRRFVVLGEHAYALVTLWVIGTHAFKARSVWPLLLARSPQPSCGKSTLLDVLERLVANPFIASNASLATLFRSAANNPTQLLDELDRWLERDPEIIGFLCAGWQTGRPFVRCHPDTHELQEFHCYGPRALALIGDVADEALRSRCIVVEMRRALPGERPQRFRAALPHADLVALQAQAARWATDHLEQVAGYAIAEAELAELTGRAADNGEALCAVAEALGGAWPERCRAALITAPVEESHDLGAMLLDDLALLLDEMPDAEAIPTSKIIEFLLAQDDRPWPTVSKGGKSLEANGLRRRLQPFGIRPDRPYIGGKQQRGYLVDPIREAIARYRTPRTPSPSEPGNQVSQVSCRLEGTVSEALVEPESAATRQQDTQDASRAGSARQGDRERRVAPLAVGSRLWKDWQARTAALEADGVERGEAEFRAGDELGLLVAEQQR